MYKYKKKFIIPIYRLLYHVVNKTHNMVTVTEWNRYIILDIL